MNQQKIDYSQFGFRKDYDPNNRIVKQEDVIYNGLVYFVSTVDLGLDHSFGAGEPLYYETMIFLKGTPSDLYCYRYTTREAALEGHNKVVEAMKSNEIIYEDGYFDIKDSDID